MKIIAESYDSAIIVQPGATRRAMLVVAGMAYGQVLSPVREWNPPLAARNAGHEDNCRVI